MIDGLCGEIYENCDLLVYCAVSSGNFLPTFRDNLSVTFSGGRSKRMVPIIFVSNQPDAQFFSMYVYFYSLHVSGSYVSIIRRINFINTTSGICHSV